MQRARRAELVLAALRERGAPCDAAALECDARASDDDSAGLNFERAVADLERLGLVVRAPDRRGADHGSADVAAGQLALAGSEDELLATLRAHWSDLFDS